MTRIDHYDARFVESFPTPMEPGVLYVSMSYSTAGHICPCGCGREVVTKLSPARWRVIYDGEVSLKPSVASTGLPCNSHYFITRGEVDWRYQLNAVHAAKAQAADRRAIAGRRQRPRHSVLTGGRESGVALADRIARSGTICGRNRAARRPVDQPDT